MTSRKLFADLLKEQSKRRLWPIALSIAANFFAQIVYTMIIFGHYKQRLENESTNLSDIRINFYNDVAGLGNGPVIFILFVLAFILAIQGYSYLFDSRQMDLYYSLPVKRQQLFDVNNLCGILIFAVPYLICNMITVIMGLVKGYATWNTILLYPASALVVVIMFIMCYEICCLAAVLTGHIVVAALGCAMFFFFGPVSSVVYEILKDTFLSSYWSDSSSIDAYTRWTPITLVLRTIERFHGDSQHEIAFYTFDAALGMLMIVILAIGCFVLSRVLVKMRPAEAAGKAMAFNITKPVLKIIVSVVGAIGAGLMIYFIGYSRSFGMLIFGMICGLVVIHVVIETIYEFDFKACLKHRGTLLGSAVISSLIFIGFIFDIFGYETWQPMPSRVESVAIAENFTYPNIIAPSEKVTDGVDNVTFYNSTASGMEYALCHMKLTDLDKVEKLTVQGAIEAKKSHKDAIKYRLFSPDYIYYDFNEYDDTVDSPSYEYITVQWNLKNGKRVRRQYKLNKNDQELFAIYRDLYDSEEYKLGKFPVTGISEGEIDGLNGQSLSGSFEQKLSKEDMDEFIKIYTNELMAQSLDDLSKQTPTIMINGSKATGNKLYYEYYNKYNFYVFPSFTGTIAFLEQHNIPTSWWNGNDDMDKVTIEVDQWDEEKEQNIHGEWSSNDRNEIQAVTSNCIPDELFNATGLYDYADITQKGWDNVYFSYNSKTTSDGEYVYLLNSENLPEKLKAICFSDDIEKKSDAAVTDGVSNAGYNESASGWIKCVSNG
ncbi:DUF6449 domain-containing protein [Butyrivibrio sp. WCE2006]|uniref:DUF6449 domain-containing protein n=1 Tax=Butyrivibrio sp. WCE2006 TaxID=1410611 RepID=UPI0005D20886|nr:DUF6449 domain-containing protein [Butyrivibrio sp. WCE2006]